MCLSTTVFAMFLTVIGPEKIESQPGRYIIHAETQDVHWVAGVDKDRWCTVAPYMDRFRTAALREG